MPEDLQQLYEASADEMFYCIGLVQSPGEHEKPFVQIIFPHWSRTKLEVVRETLADGLVMTATDRSPRPSCIHLATCQRVVISLARNGETDVLRGPAWDATLENIDPIAFQSFNEARQRAGGFRLMLQTKQWEFDCSVDASGKTLQNLVRAR